ncbi:MAG: GyrI-like domain-containing protein [Alphaproteobacteria bacterium]
MKSYEVKAGLQDVEAFEVVGISIITRNEAASEDINALWERFFKESVGQKIDSRVDDVIYTVYSDYEGDHTKPYRFTIGYKVKDETDLNGSSLHQVKVKAAPYALMSAAGEQPKALIETWTAIWQSDLDRRFETDFEVYGQRFFEDGVHEVLVAIGVNV